MRGESFHSGWELQILADVDVVALAPASVALDLPAGIVSAVISAPPDQLETAIVWRRDDRSFRDEPGVSRSGASGLLRRAHLGRAGET